MKKTYAPVNQLFPQKRTRLRLFCGVKYFTLKRYFKWMLTAGQFARTFSRPHCPMPASSHATPLCGNLKDVDMQLQYYKITNLKLHKKLNGILIRPGETFLTGRQSENRRAVRDYLKEWYVLRYGRQGIAAD